jgi:hypothetical protein
MAGAGPALAQPVIGAQSLGGTVKSAAADSLVVTGKARDGRIVERTFIVDARTRIRKHGKDSSVTDLAPGEPVHVRYHAEGGRAIADAVVVRTPRTAPSPGPDGRPVPPRKE